MTNPPNDSSILDAAIAYTRAGCAVVPVPHKQKGPRIKEWQNFRLGEGDLCRYFGKGPRNIGLLLGEPSGWRVDVDLDHPLALELADEHLPPTRAVFGRASKPRSHRIYLVTSPVETKKHSCPAGGTLVEIRSTGVQTIVPPSTHTSGEQIEWEPDAGEPAWIDGDELGEAVARLADAVRVRLGVALGDAAPLDAAPTDPPSHEALVQCLASMRRIRRVDQNDGSFRLYLAACRCAEHGLDDHQAIRCIRDYERERPFPRSWSDADVLDRLGDARVHVQRCGTRLDDSGTETPGLVPLGGTDPQTGRIILSPTRTLPTARSFVREFDDHPEYRTIHAYASVFHRWRGNRYVPIEDGALRHELHPWLHDALRYVKKRNGELVLEDFNANPGSVNAALETIRSYTHLPATTIMPCWADARETDPPATEILPCHTVNLHLPTGRALPRTPRLLNFHALDFDYDPDAEIAEEWDRFLGQLFGEDFESVQLLQEWMGYSVTADTSQQKMLLLVGPRRSGKGTIARVLRRLVGEGNVAGPTTSSLAGPFGLQPLIGKTVALVSDARFSGDHVSIVTERLLCISGEDTLTVDRKHLPSVTLKLPTRFTFLTNELPRFSDASTALAGRFLVLRLTKSFYGQEDPTLTNKLLAELPGILNWALGGLQRLQERGRFVSPPSVEDAIRDMEDLASPVGAFIRERCVVGPGHRICLDDLYGAWKAWCAQDGRTTVPTRATFGRDLATALPGVVRRRGTEQVAFYEGIALRIPSF